MNDVAATQHIKHTEQTLEWGRCVSDFDCETVVSARYDDSNVSNCKALMIFMHHSL